jgi:16S rRNA (cytosine967-C5)-methyltransferase
MPKMPTPPSPDQKPGLPAREAGMRLFHRLLHAKKPPEDEGDAPETSGLPADDRALARAISTVSFRHFGTLRLALESRLESEWPDAAGLLQPILVTAAAQILFMDVPDHSAVDLGISLVQRDSQARRYAKLGNALLRRITREKDAILDQWRSNPGQDLPVFFLERWARVYGETGAESIALALRQRAAIDLTPNPAIAFDLSALPHHRLSCGSLRLATDARIESLPGYAEGAWWVQDAAASLPARLLAVKPGERALDLCAAPGGKTAQLAAAGAKVTALDRSGSRLQRLKQNLARLGLEAEIVEADGASFATEPFDAILIDAPCSATGTIRRHPELPWTRTLADIARLAALQTRLLDNAAKLLKPGGRLVYATCSLEPEEGEKRIATFLESHPDFERMPIEAPEIPGFEEAVNAAGDLRILPGLLQSGVQDLVANGTDGFFAARIRLKNLA